MATGSSNIMNPSESSFREQVLGSSLPTLVDFWAPWCPPCRMLKPELERIARSLEGRANVAFVNVDEHPGLAAAFHVSSIPALLVVKNGKVVDRWKGFSPGEAVVERLMPHMAA